MYWGSRLRRARPGNALFEVYLLPGPGRERGPLARWLLVPTFARAGAVTTVMNTRGHRGGRNRARLRRMHATPFDWAMLALVVVWVLAAWLLPDVLA